MGLFDGLVGNSSSISTEEATKIFKDILGENETIFIAFKLIRDTIGFTNSRVVFLDKQGITGKKCSFLSIPYKSISMFSIETSGTFDLDSELKIWVSSSLIVDKKFNKNVNIFEIQKVLATYVANV